ncbi:pyridoxal phosphate-dependent transferase [Xylaria scruposa]|nr:pyridoxal phosphate-dependent transferase [Xylaria scruposa]
MRPRPTWLPTSTSPTTNEGKFGKIPEASTWSLSKDAAFVYYCDNETDGVQSPNFSEVLAPKDDGTGPIVVADMSSNILSRKFSVRNFSLVFFGAQKNLGSTGITVLIIKKSLAAEHSSNFSYSNEKARSTHPAGRSYL